MLERVGRYRVRHRIAVGGFASVYLADDPVLDSPVAVKVLADDLAAVPDLRIRFLREARVMRRVTSERLVTVYDIGELDHGQPYLVMEYLSLGTLADRADRLRGQGWQPSPDDLMTVISQLADGLSVLHAAAVVHRDLKPSNLMLRQGEHTVHGESGRLIRSGEKLVLADFGLAKILEPGTGGLTIGGGTRGFMAPEQHQPNVVVDARADLFAASAILLALLTGRPPPDSVTAARALDDELAQVGGAFGAALRRGLSSAPQTRFDSVDEWRRHMASAAESIAPARRGSSRILDIAEIRRDPAKPAHGFRRSGWAWLAAALAALAALGGLHAFGLLPGGDQLPGAGLLADADPAVRVTGPQRLAVGDAGAWVAIAQTPTTFEWTAPDGTVHTGPELVITPTRPGTVEIDLIALDTDGNRVELSMPLAVYDADPLLRIIGPALLSVGQTVTLRADAPDGVAVTWIDWAGAEHVGGTLTLRARTPGRLTVKLKATVAGEPHQVERTIMVVAR